MPSKNSDEKLLRRSGRIKEPLARHDLAPRVARGIEDASRARERRGKSDLSRPNGPIIWFHVFGLQGALNLVGVMQQISEEIPEINFLVTSQDQIQDYVFELRMPVNVLHQYAPFDKFEAVERFLDHWSPGMCVWTDDTLMPVMIHAIFERGMPSIFANVDNVDAANPHFSWVPDIGKPFLRKFDKILVIDSKAQTRVKQLGAEATVMRALREEVLTLPLDETRRSRVSKQLDGRPVWLAARIRSDEIDQILDAHKKALRQIHRLILIIVPADPEDTARIFDNCKTLDLHFERSNDLDEIPPRMDVIVAQGDNGLGLWYQMAVVCFVGASLRSHGGYSPLEAASLGSAIIHGPYVDNYADIYMRLRDAGAAIEVASVSSLVEAITELVTPNRAAVMAHAGWMISSEGADATDKLVEAIWDHYPIGVAP
jgi:3-deoxy-D-manno-octulosonic-acid transferase